MIMEDRYKVRTGLSFGSTVARYSVASGASKCWRPLLTKAVLGLAALTCLWPLADSAHAQSGSSVNRAVGGASSSMQRPAEIDATWIWSPRLDVTTTANQGEVYFRKKFTLLKPERAELTLAAGDEFELFINGEMIANGQSYGAVTKFDPTPFLESGTNLVAVRVNHLDSKRVGLAMKMRIKEAGEVKYRVLRTDSTWRSYTAKAYEWYKNGFNAKSWLTSKPVNLNAGSSATPRVAVFGGAAKQKGLGGSLDIEVNENAFSAPQKSRVKLSSQRVAAPPVAKKAVAVPALPTVLPQVKNLPKAKEFVSQTVAPRFSKPNFVPAPVGGMDNVPPALPAKIPTAKAASKPLPKAPIQKSAMMPLGIKPNSEFSVTTVLSRQQAGSVIAMEFNEYGQLLLSREGGPLLIADLVPQPLPAKVLMAKDCTGCLTKTAMVRQKSRTRCWNLLVN